MSKRDYRNRSQSIDHDDSTDDEAVGKAVSEYNIDEAVKQFSEIRSIKNGSYGNPANLELAFALHAFGRAIYFSEPVNAIYGAVGGLKERNLKSDGGVDRKVSDRTRFPTEGESLSGESNYIAHRRLTDRSQKRLGKNKLNNSDKAAVALDTVFIFSEGSESKERKEFTPHGSKPGTYNGYRGDWIGFDQHKEEIPYQPNGRTSVMSIIQSLIDDEMSDQEVARNIRATLKGEEVGLSPEQKKSLAFLTNLMFGAEASRNPACYVSSQIFLDLIENSHAGYETWRQAFAAEKFPMMIKDEIAGSRRINDLLNGEEVMPYDYHYDYNASHDIARPLYGATESPSQKADKNAKEILSREIVLAKDWLGMNGCEEDFGSLVALLKTKIPDWYSDVDLSHFSEWQFEEKEAQAKESSARFNLSADFDDAKAHELDDIADQKSSSISTADAKRKSEKDTPDASFRPESKKSKPLLRQSGGRGIGGIDSKDEG